MRPIMAILMAFIAMPSWAESHLERVRAKGAIVMLCFPQQDNEFIFVRTEAGPMLKVGDARHFGGIDVDILALVAAELGVELRIQPIPEPSIELVFAQLENGDGDVAGGSLTITESREERVDFSTPYVPVYEAVIVRANSDIERPRHLSKRRVAVLAGSSHHEVIRRRGVAEEIIIPVDFTIAALVAVQDGEADYTLLDAYGPDASVALSRDLRKAFVLPDEVGGIGLALPDGSDLRPIVDRVIERLRETGELETIINRHKRW